MPSVSVIVPVRNESRSIEHTLRSLLTQDFPAGDFEVIVADGRVHRRHGARSFAACRASSRT